MADPLAHNPDKSQPTKRIGGEEPYTKSRALGVSSSKRSAQTGDHYRGIEPQGTRHSSKEGEPSAGGFDKLAMAADPEWINRWIQENGPYLYHGAHPRDGRPQEEVAQSILTQGLIPNQQRTQPPYPGESQNLCPGCETKGSIGDDGVCFVCGQNAHDAPLNPGLDQDLEEWWLHPRSNHVFMVTNPHQAYGRPLFRIDLRRLDPAKLKADDDMLRDYHPEKINFHKWTEPTETNPPRTLGEQAEAIGWGDNPEDTHNSFEQHGVVAHEGPIPPEAIERIDNTPLDPTRHANALANPMTKPNAQSRPDRKLTQVDISNRGAGQVGEHGILPKNSGGQDGRARADQARPRAEHQQARQGRLTDEQRNASNHQPSSKGGERTTPSQQARLADASADGVIHPRDIQGNGTWLCPKGHQQPREPSLGYQSYCEGCHAFIPRDHFIYYAGNPALDQVMQSRSAAQYDGFNRDWEPGDQAHFEYHCFESPKSADADLWQHSHQPVTVLGIAGPGLENSTAGERAEAGMPRYYRIRFPDGLEHEAWDDELMEHPSEFYRPGPKQAGIRLDNQVPIDPRLKNQPFLPQDQPPTHCRFCGHELDAHPNATGDPVNLRCNNARCLAYGVWVHDDNNVPNSAAGMIQNKLRQAAQQDEWWKDPNRAEWQHGLCDAYALAMLEMHPHLKLGVAGDMDFFPSHFFAHDDQYAYDSLGRHPLPYHGASGNFEVSNLNENPADWSAMRDEQGRVMPENGGREDMERAKALIAQQHPYLSQRDSSVHSAQQIMYHVAPVQHREVIEQEGLRHDVPSRWSDGPTDGVYLYSDPTHAENYAEGFNPTPHDIWEVNVDGLPIEADPEDYDQYEQDVNGADREDIPFESWAEDQRANGSEIGTRYVVPHTIGPHRLERWSNDTDDVWPLKRPDGTEIHSQGSADDQSYGHAQNVLDTLREKNSAHAARSDYRLPGPEDFGSDWPEDVGCRSYAEKVNELNPELRYTEGWTRAKGSEKKWGEHAWNVSPQGEIIDQYYELHPYAHKGPVEYHEHGPDVYEQQPPRLSSLDQPTIPPPSTPPYVRVTQRGTHIDITWED